MRSYLSTTLVSLLVLSFTSSDFKSEQLRYPRVRTAFAEKEAGIARDLISRGIATQQLKIYLRAFKTERKIEVWVSNGDRHTVFRTYDFCSTSGTLGPKRRQGDGQIPEGLYHISNFNPASNFFLSLGLDYPNASDLKRKTSDNAGGDIFIHGDCVTIGCIPITDNKIKELYVLAVLAKSAGQEHIPVHIFPFKMTQTNLSHFSGSTHDGFWKELKPFYDAFESNKRVPTFRILPTGQYSKS